MTARKCELSHRGVRSLTKRGISGTVLVTTDNKANRVKCWHTPHGSNPTLIMPVTGLRNIVLYRKASVLRGLSGPTDLHVGLGRFVVPVGGRV